MLRTDLGQPEVQNLHATLAGKQNVARLEIPMDNPGAMRRGQALGDLHCDVDCFSRAQRAAIDRDAQSLALDQLGDNPISAVLVADVVNRNDIGMVQGAGRTGLPFKARNPVRIVREAQGKHFDRDIPLQL